MHDTIQMYKKNLTGCKDAVIITLCNTLLNKLGSNTLICVLK